VIFVHQNLISNLLTYLVHAKSAASELISFGFSDCSVQSMVSAKCSASGPSPNEKTTSLFD